MNISDSQESEGRLDAAIKTVQEIVRRPGEDAAAHRIQFPTSVVIAAGTCFVDWRSFRLYCAPFQGVR